MGTGSIGRSRVKSLRYDYKPYSRESPAEKLAEELHGFHILR